MDEPSDEWDIEEDSSSACCSSKASWFFDKGLWLGKRVAITGFVISSAPLVLPPLVVASALGIAVSIPSGVVIASYACTEKLMSKLLPRPTSGTIFEEETEVEFGEDLSAEEDTQEYVKDAKSWFETREGLLEGRDGEVLYEYVESCNQEPFEEPPRSSGGIGSEDFGEDFNASRDDHCSGHIHTECNNEEPMNVVDVEKWNKKDVGEESNTSEDDYAYGHTHTENNDEQPMNDLGAKIKEEGYQEDVDEDLKASNGYGSVHTNTEYNEEEPMNDLGAEIKEEGYQEDVDEDFNASGDNYGIRHTHAEHDGEEPMDGADANDKQEGYVEYVGEYLNASRDEYGELSTHAGYNAAEPMNDVDTEVKEDVGEDLNKSRDYYGSGHTDTEFNDRMNDEDAKIKEEGYEEDVGEYLQGEDEGPLEGFDVETEEAGKEETEGTVPVIEQSMYGGHVHEDISQRNEEIDKTTIEECILAGEIMELIGNLTQEGDGSSPVKEADREEDEKCRITEEREEKNFTSSEENGKMKDEEQPTTGANKDVEMNDIDDAKVKEEEFKKKVDEHAGNDERPLQDFLVEIEEDGEEEKQETELVIERAKWDQQADDVQKGDAMVEINDKSAPKNIGDENFAGETTRLIEELREEGNISSPVEKVGDEEKNGVSKERDEKLITVYGKAESEMINEERKEIEETQATLEDDSDDVLAKSERKVPLGTVSEVNKDENNGVVVSEKPTTDRNGSYSGEGDMKVEEVAEKETCVDNKKTVKRKRRSKNRTSGEERKGSQSAEKKEIVFSDADAREIADESGFLLFDHREKDGESYPCSAFENPAVYEKTAHGAAESGVPLEIRLPEVVTKSSKSGLALEPHCAVSAGKLLLDEAKIWENIEALRTIVGYNVAPQESCVDELKSLYVFTGVEPPTLFKSPSDLAEVNDKLHFLMAIVGVK